MQLTIDQAAAAMGKSARQIRYLIQQGRVQARKVQGRWLIDGDSLPNGASKQKASARKVEQIQETVENALDLPPRSQTKRFTVRSLKAIEIGLPIYRDAVAKLGADHPACAALQTLFEHVVRGAHRFENPDKLEAYRAGRDAASLAVCNLLIAGDETASAIADTIEQELMPAITGLLRRLSRKSNQR